MPLWTDPACLPFYDYDAMHPATRQRQEEADARPDRRGIYTTVKDDHEHPFHTEEPCNCQRGDWESYAMRVTYPENARLRQAQLDREPC
jgi:hypothetical protein